jgi:HD domain
MWAESMAFEVSVVAIRWLAGPAREAVFILLHSAGWATMRWVTEHMNTTPRYAKALTLAHELHSGQVRKGTSIPYISHLIAVSAIVLEHGGDEDEAIAALLHDAVEDCGGAPVLAKIRRRFGRRVADIVAACSDTDVTPKPPWQARKEAYLAHLSDAAPSVLLVSAADKLHNARSILSDYRQTGEVLWRRFNASKDQTLWYYRALVEAFAAHGRGPLVEELERIVAEIEQLARPPYARYLDAKLKPTPNGRYQPSEIAEMQCAMFEALKTGEPIPSEMQMHLSFAFENLCAGIPDELFMLPFNGGQAKPIRKHLQGDAIRYLRWVKDGKISDGRPIQNIADWYGVERRSVSRWVKEWGDKPTPGLHEDFGEDVVKCAAIQSGKRYYKW